MGKFDKAYEDGLLDGVLTTNLIYQSPELLSRPYYINCDMSKYIALVIDTLNHDGSISSILDPSERIQNIVQKYKNKGVRVEDLIQEGNMGLVMAVNELEGVAEAVEEAYLLNVIEHAIVAAIDEESNEESEEDTIVAKANLIREAAKHLEEELGQAPSVKELQEFTKITEEEIRDILNLSKEK